MKRILINAYACCPNFGSEQGMAWNFITNIARQCECFVITESEYQSTLESSLSPAPSDSVDGMNEYGLTETQIRNMHFFFVPAGDTEEDSVRIRKMCWNQGTWAFYKYYAEWQEKILPVAEQIIEENDIDIMHQLNMVGFREPGMLYRINEKRVAEGKKRIPLIWGPSAGFGSIPFSFMTGGGLKFTAFYLLKNFLNKVQLKWHPRVRKMVAASDMLLAATPEMRDGFRKYYGKEVELINETGTFVVGEQSPLVREEVSRAHGLERGEQRPFRMLWVGRLMYTKQLEIALRTMGMLYDLKDVELHIVGKAFDLHTEDLMRYRAEEAGCEDVVKWHGQIPNAEVQRMMRESDIFFFTSIFEATSTVILEAITNNLPIVCFDRCGFGPIVDEKIGRKIPCISPKQAVRDFAKEITYLYHHPEELQQMKRNCEEKKVALSWNVKIERLMRIYEEVSGAHGLEVRG